MINEEELSDEELLAVLLGKMFKHFCSFIEERGLGSEFAKWMIHDRNEALIDLVRFGGVSDRILEEAEDRGDISGSKVNAKGSIL